MVLITAKHVTRTYNVGRPDEMTALNGVSFAVNRGAVAVLKGPSGSGKTSLLSLVGCMGRPTEGRIVVDGKDIVKLPERFLARIRQKKFGFIFQQFHLIKDLTVIENVLLPLYPTAVSSKEMQERACSILEKLQVLEKKRLKVKHLSGGEQQRVAIARALINEPMVIIADEPTAHLDAELAEEFMEILSVLHNEGKTIIIATHDPFIHEHPLVSMTISLHGGRVEGITST
jgi:putative ABC transport system ATP-binding protein